VKLDVRALFAVVALLLAACQGGLDSGAGGMGGFGSSGEVGPPVNGQGPLGGQQQPIGTNTGGPTAGPNGIAELANPGATLAPDQTQYPVADGPSGLKCASVGGFSCTFSFNVPSPSPSPSGSSSPSPKPSPTPTPTPTAKASGDDAEDDTSDEPTPTPTPPGTLTMQMEPLPSDVPVMTNPDPRALKIVTLVGIRIQSDTDFTLDGTAIAHYVLPRQQFAGRGFALQLYNESFPRVGRSSKRIDTFVGNYSKAVLGNSTVDFTFTIPKVEVKRGQIWLLALYGLTYPPGTTPSPSPSPSSSGSPAPSASPSGSPAPSPSATGHA